MLNCVELSVKIIEVRIPYTGPAAAAGTRALLYTPPACGLVDSVGNAASGATELSTAGNASGRLGFQRSRFSAAAMGRFTGV